jgi:hypothetical protein
MAKPFKGTINLDLQDSTEDREAETRLAALMARD